MSLFDIEKVQQTLKDSSMFEEVYDQLVDSFGEVRKELLELTTEVVPTPAEMHQRRWRSQQLKNTNNDLKDALAACNAQLDAERAILDELNQENERIAAQERKLEEDIKLLEGVTGMRSTVFYNQNIGVAKEISDTSQQFREEFAEFYLQMGHLNQDLPPDPTILKDSGVLIETLRDYSILQFDQRASTAELSRTIDGLSRQAAQLDKQLQEETIKLEHEMATDREAIEGVAGEEKQELLKQSRDLRKQGRTLVSELQATKARLEKKVETLTDQKNRMKQRIKNLQTQKSTLRQSYKSRASALELELDRFENRINAIRENPDIVDQALINISLLLTKKSRKIDAAIASMRKEISEFNEWIRN